MDTAQRFSLGVLVTPTQTSAPEEVNLRLSGRGIFCQLSLEFSFAADDPGVARVFALDRPWNSVLTEVSVNGEAVSKSQLHTTPGSLPQSLKDGVDEVLQEGSAEGICCYIQPGTSLRTLQLTFVMACDVLWHQSVISFFSAVDACKVNAEIWWDLSGLTGAGLSCLGEAADSRFSQLEGSRLQWAESVTLERGRQFGVRLALDEKKAASLCLYSNSPGEPGCGAVVVVAPVRPQLQRKPVKVAVLMEIRNPQEGLIARELIDRLCATLNPDDQMSLHVMGSSMANCVMPWREVSQVSEEVFSQLLDPSSMGRPQYFWELFKTLLTENTEATHILLTTPGPKELPPAELSTNLPVFCFVTARKPNSSTLGELSGGTGSFVSEHSVDGVDSFLQRLNVRLSPPLLREFRLEGWGLERSVPSKPTQVFMDKPTLVFGRYEGLLPQTVTLAGVAPGGQKLGQRVKVESFSGFTLAPLHEHACRLGYDFDHNVQQFWNGGPVQLFEVSRPVPTSELFSVEEAEHESVDPMSAPPTMEPVSTAVTMDDEYLGNMDFEQNFNQGFADDFFNGSAGETISDDMFGSPPSLMDTISDGYFTPGDESPLGDFPDLPEREAPSIVIDDIPPMDFSGPAPTEALPRIQFSGPQFEDDSNGPGPEEDSGPDPFTFGTESAPEPQPVPSQDSPFEDSQESFPTTEDSGERLEPVSEPSGLVPISTKGDSEERTTGAEKATLSVKMSVPEWVKRLVSMGGSRMQVWLNACPIDTLSLGLAHTEEDLVGTLLEKLTAPRRMAVETQIEWGRLLSEKECEEACLELEEMLKAEKALSG